MVKAIPRHPLLALLELSLLAGLFTGNILGLFARVTDSTKIGSGLAQLNR